MHCTAIAPHLQIKMTVGSNMRAGGSSSRRPTFQRALLTEIFSKKPGGRLPDASETTIQICHTLKVLTRPQCCQTRFAGWSRFGDTPIPSLARSLQLRVQSAQSSHSQSTGQLALVQSRSSLAGGQMQTRPIQRCPGAQSHSCCSSCSSTGYDHHIRAEWLPQSSMQTNGT